MKMGYAMLCASCCHCSVSLETVIVNFADFVIFKLKFNATFWSSLIFCGA
jgi:hypothetical protein